MRYFTHMYIVILLCCYNVTVWRGLLFYFLFLFQPREGHSREGQSETVKNVVKQTSPHYSATSPPLSMTIVIMCNFFFLFLYRTHTHYTRFSPFIGTLYIKNHRQRQQQQQKQRQQQQQLYWRPGGAFT